MSTTEPTSPTARTRVRRVAHRGHYDRTTLHAILAPGKKSETQRAPKPATPKPPAAQQAPAPAQVTAQS